MKLPPLFAFVQIASARGPSPLFWWPLCLLASLLWPFALVLCAALLAPAILLFALFAPRAYRDVFRFARGVYDVLCASRGTRIEVNAPDARVLITLR